MIAIQKYYKDTKNKVYSFDINCDDCFIKDGLISITKEEADSLSTPQIKAGDYKEQQKKIIRDECRNAITSNFFTSNTHTVGYKYDCRDVDQTNLERRRNKAKKTNSTVGVYAHNGVEFVKVQHTLEQIEDVLVDMDNHVESKRDILYSAVSAINTLDNETATCEDIDNIVNAIVW